MKWRLGNIAEARQAFDQSHSILEQLVTEIDHATYDEKLAESRADAARFLTAQGERDAARLAWKKATRNMQRAVQVQPGNRAMQQRLDTLLQALEQFETDSD